MALALILDKKDRDMDEVCNTLDNLVAWYRGRSACFRERCDKRLWEISCRVADKHSRNKKT